MAQALLLPKSSALEMLLLDSLARLELLKELETAIWLLVGLHTKLTGIVSPDWLLTQGFFVVGKTGKCEPLTSLY